MCDIQQNMCLYIFAITIYIMWNGGWMEKVLDCEWKGEGSNLSLNMLCPWHQHDDLLKMKWKV